MAPTDSVDEWPNPGQPLFHGSEWRMAAGWIAVLVLSAVVAAYASYRR